MPDGIIPVAKLDPLVVKRQKVQQAQQRVSKAAQLMSPLQGDPDDADLKASITKSLQSAMDTLNSL